MWCVLFLLVAGSCKIGCVELSAYRGVLTNGQGFMCSYSCDIRPCDSARSWGACVPACMCLWVDGWAYTQVKRKKWVLERQGQKEERQGVSCVVWGPSR